MLQGLSSSAGGMPGGLGMESGKSRSLEGKEKESSFSQLLSQKAPKERKETKSPTTDANDRSAKSQLKTENRNKAETTPKSGEAKQDEGSSSEIAENTQTKAEKAEGKTAKGKKAEGQQKQKAMQKFMDSIESEFGIPPTRIVEAMANLSETQLQMPPEDTASAVVAQFNLNPAQTQKAESMYLKMLADTQSPGSTGENKGGMLIPEFFTPVTPESSKAEMMAGGLGGAALLARMTAADRRQHVNAGLDAMNNKFFVNPLTQQKTAGLETQAPTNPESVMGIENLESAQSVVPQLPLDKFEVLPQVDPGAIAPPEALPVQTPGLTSTDDLAAALQALDRAAMNLAPKAAGGEEVVLSAGKDLAGLGLGAVSLAVGADAVSAAEDKQQDFSDSAKQDSSNQDFFLNREAQGLNGKLQKPTLGAGALGAGAGQAFNLNNVSREQRAENIQRIMDKANVIAQKGGGSMRLQMTPEGLGTIDLKVSVVNGKMDMQLKTETNEAKQLLENSLGELKHSLASQKLSLENVKVDVGLDSRDNGQSMSQHQRHPGSDDASREAARQFLGQFRQQNSEGRSGFLEAPGMKAYAPKKKEDLAPITEAQVRRTAEHKGNGVNLVA